MKELKERKKGLSMRGIILIVAVLIIVVTTIVILVNVNKPKEKENLNNETNVEKPKEEIKDPETKPSIDGNENVTEDGGIKVNNSEKLKESKKFETYVLSNAKLINTNGVTKFTADVSSTSAVKLSGIDVKIKLMDKDGKYISSLSAYMPQVKPGETSTLVSSSSSDLSNAYSYEIVKE